MAIEQGGREGPDFDGNFIKNNRVTTICGVPCSEWRYFSGRVEETEREFHVCPNPQDPDSYYVIEKEGEFGPRRVYSIRGPNGGERLGLLLGFPIEVRSVDQNVLIGLDCEITTMELVRRAVI